MQIKKLVGYLQKHKVYPAIVFILIFTPLAVHILLTSHAAPLSASKEQESNNTSAILQYNAQILALDNNARLNATKITPAAISNSSAAALVQTVSSNVANALEQSNISSKLSSVATKRSALLVNLMQSDPEEASKLILPDEVLSDFSTINNPDLERKVTLSGTYEVFHKDPVSESAPDVFDYEVVSKTGTVTHLYTNGDFANITPGSQITAQAYQIKNDALVVTATPELSTAGAMEATAAAPAPPLGTMKTAVILGTFNDDSSTALTTSSNQAMFTGSSGLESWINQVSYGKLQLSPTFFGPYTLTDTLESSNVCPAAAENDGTELNSELANLANSDLVKSNPNGWAGYQNIIFEFNCYASSYGGYAYVGETPFTPPGSTTSFYTGLSYDFGDGGTLAEEEHVLAHEISHTLGNYHANAYDCQTSALVPEDNFDIQDQGCNSIQYGNPFDVLGSTSSTVLNHQDVLHKANAGWFSASNYLVLNKPGTYTYKLLPYETPTSGILAINIPRGPAGGDSFDSQTSFTLEYRQPIGFDSSLAAGGSACQGETSCDATKGPMINLNQFVYGFGGGGDTQLIDANTTNGDNFFDSALLPGKTFTDPQTGISISTVSANSSGATVTVKIPKSVSSCTRNAATVTQVSQVNSATYPTPLTYTYKVTSNDVGSCSAEEYKFLNYPVGAVNLNNNFLGNFAVLASPDLFYLSPGQSVDVTVSLTPDNQTTAGTYDFNESLGTFIANDQYNDATYLSGTGTVTSSQTYGSSQPSPPTGLSATELGSSAVSVNWSAPTSGNQVAGYVVTVNNTYSYWLSTVTSAVLINSGFVAGSTNNIKIQDFDRAGNLSTNVATTVNLPLVTDTTPPSEPGNLTATATDHSVTLNWAASTDNVGVAGYLISGIEGTVNGSTSNATYLMVNGNTTSVTFTSLPTDTTFHIDLQAVDGADNMSDSLLTSPDIINVTTAFSGDTAPAQPNSLYSPSANLSDIKLSWDASKSSTGVSGYYLLRGSLPITSTLTPVFNVIDTTTSTSYTDKLTPAQYCTFYYYYVVAFDKNGDLSPESNVFEVSTACGTKTIKTMKVPVLEGITNNETVSGTVDLTAIANVPPPPTSGHGGGNLGGMYYYIDNEIYQGAYTKPYEYQLNTLNLSNGKHTIYGLAMDKYYNYSSSIPITFYINN